MSTITFCLLLYLLQALVKSVCHISTNCGPPCSLFVGMICDLAVSVNGELASTVSDDKVVKVFDVVNFGN